MKISREQELEYRIVIWQSRDDHIALAFRALISNLLEKVKDNAITPGGGDISELQGEARAYQHILKFLTSPPTSTKQV